MTDGSADAAPATVARWARRLARDILDGLDEGYRLLGPVGFVSAGILVVLMLVVLARA